MDTHGVSVQTLGCLMDIHVSFKMNLVHCVQYEIVFIILTMCQKVCVPEAARRLAGRQHPHQIDVVFPGLAEHHFC